MNWKLDQLKKKKSWAFYAIDVKKIATKEKWHHTKGKQPKVSK